MIHYLKGAVCYLARPSQGGHSCKDWLGIKANGQQFTCRVSDWWRREGNLLIENWVFVDLIDMLKQLDYDVFKETNIQIQTYQS